MSAFAAPPVDALIIDGQNNHDWKSTTPVLKSILEETGLFQVDVLTTPPKGGDFSGAAGEGRDKPDALHGGDVVPQRGVEDPALAIPQRHQGRHGEGHAEGAGGFPDGGQGEHAVVRSLTLLVLCEASGNAKRRYKATDERG